MKPQASFVLKSMASVVHFNVEYILGFQIVEREEKTVMVLEDDVRFEPFFRRKVSALLEEMKQLQLNWDLM